MEVESMTVVVVVNRRQVTIPVQLRRKFGIEKSSKVEIVEQYGLIVIRKRPSILDLAGSGTGKGNVDELKKVHDKLRAEDA